MHAKVSRYLMFGLGFLAVVGIGIVTISSASKLFLSAEARFNPISPPQATPADTSATIEWESRDKVVSIVYYGSATDSVTLPALEATETTRHKVFIANILPKNTYYYRIFTSGKYYPPQDAEPLSFTTTALISPQESYPPCLITVFEGYYGSKIGDGRYNPAYDIYPPGKPDGIISIQDYLQCIKVNPPK